MRARAALVLALMAGPALAQDEVALPGLVSDEAFFRAVACGAPPGGACTEPFTRWPIDRPIRVALRQIDAAYLGRPKLRAHAALTRALQALNGAGAGFRLAEVPAEAPAEIEVFFLDLAEGDPISGTGIEGVDGARLGPAATRVLFNHDSGYIERAALVFSTSLATRAYEGAMLAEMTQAMGLMTGVTAAAYDGVSVLAAGTAGTARPTRLGPQDIMALRRLYQDPLPR